MSKMTRQEALQIIYDLAEGNALDATDPDVRGDDALAESAARQEKALAVVSTMLSVGV